MLSIVTGTFTLLVIKPALNVAESVVVSKSAPKCVIMLYFILQNSQPVLVAEGGVSWEGKTATLNGLAILPEVMDSDTRTDLDISVPMKVGAVNSTSRTVGY